MIQDEFYIFFDEQDHLIYNGTIYTLNASKSLMNGNPLTIGNPSRRTYILDCGFP